MAYCTQCRAELSAGMSFCYQCGVPTEEGVRTGQAQRRIHLDDLLYSCRQCGKEELFGKLQKCSLCHDATCDECAALCHECGQTACTKCLLDCSECGKTGCTRCFQACETCRSRGLCLDHGFDCGECGYPTCKHCVKFCKKCESEVCGHCYEHGHATTGR